MHIEFRILISFGYIKHRLSSMNCVHQEYYVVISKNTHKESSIINHTGYLIYSSTLCQEKVHNSILGTPCLLEGKRNGFRF